MILNIKNVFKILLFNILLFLLGIIIIELVFGNWIRQNNLNKLHIIRSRTFHFQLDSLYDFPSTFITYSRDKYGLRGSFNAPSEIDILTVGGSTTDQKFITDGKTWQDIIEQRSDSMEKKVILANAGVDGQTTYGHIKNFDWWFKYIPNLQPKYILFYVGLNDLFHNSTNIFDRLLITERERSLRQILRENSALYHLLRTFHGIYLAEVKLKIGHRKIDFSKVKWVNKPLHISYDDLMKEYLRSYAQRLEILVLKTLKFESIPIFVTQPCRYYRFIGDELEGAKEIFYYNDTAINGVDIYKMLRMLNQITFSICESENISYINLSDLEIWKDDDFYDYSHMTPKGVAKLGKVIFEALLENGYVNNY